MDDCAQELCPNWTGDGRVCACAMFDLEPPRLDPYGQPYATYALTGDRTGTRRPMDELIAFLNARLDEADAVIARNRGDRGLGDNASYPDYQTYDGPDIDAACEYLNTFPPPLMAADVAAKRALLTYISGELQDDPTDETARWMAATLAVPFAAHADYREEWRPAE